ncbi:MAG: hypothetical protein KDB53_16685 [Planctomycetes bacterium]|nr:hypothetical protein [Planctomycetota bacterium]
MFRSVAPIKAVLALVVLVFATSIPLTAHGALDANGRLPQGSTVTINGPLLANSPISVDIEGAPPPTPDGSPTFGLGIRLNGWTHANPPAVWNPETQTWTVTWHIPPGQRGAFCEVVFSSDRIITHSFIVR